MISVSCELPQDIFIAVNDGLTLKELYDWFQIRPAQDLNVSLAGHCIIHFTPNKYNL
jgi:hypothetical protein